MSVPRIVIAGTHSGVGKTTIATGIMAALHRRGLRVQGFKVGPDFIDPTFHTLATARPSRNLDGWMLTRETNLDIFASATADADIAVIEGVMGLFDGKGGSTAEMAQWLDATVVLVIDGSGMAGSAAAIVHGFDTLVSDLRISAVICNKVAGEKHYGYLRDAIEAHCHPAPLGYLPRDSNFAIPERHLGLHLAAQEHISGLAEWIGKHLDLDGLLRLAVRRHDNVVVRKIEKRDWKARIGVARDAAFCFYYHDNLELLRHYGAELINFSPVADRALPPELDALYLGGGYPELHAEALSTNHPMREAIAKFAADGRPIYAECGGFMYLTEAIIDAGEDAGGRAWPMVGIFPTRARMQKKFAKLGYREVQTNSGPARGHEFRYSEIDPMPGNEWGYRVNSTFASYVHLHFLSCPAFAENFVHRATQK